MLTRRALLKSAAAMLAAPRIIRPAFAKTQGEVIQCNFGGGVGAAFQESYGNLFTKSTGIPFRIVEVPSIETALMSNASSQI